MVGMESLEGAWTECMDGCGFTSPRMAAAKHTVVVAADDSSCRLLLTAARGAVHCRGQGVRCGLHVCPLGYLMFAGLQAYVHVDHPWFE